MTWTKGQSGNPTGRPVTDKTIAMKIIMQVFAEYADKFKDELKKEAEKDPVKFYRNYVSPIQPKDFTIDAAVEFTKRMFDK